MAPFHTQFRRLIPALWGNHSLCCVQKLCCLPAEKNKNPRKTAKLLWPLWLHKETAHFPDQISASTTKECFCKQHTSLRNQNSGLQLAFAQPQKHLECNKCWITTQRKRIPRLSIFPLHSSTSVRIAYGTSHQQKTTGCSQENAQIWEPPCVLHQVLTAFAP